MAIKSVQFTLNGTTHTLTYDSVSGAYKATITAPTTTSWGQTDHKYYGTVTVTDDAGNTVTATKDEYPALGLRVLEKVAPTVAVTYPAAGAYVTSASPTIQWTVTDTGSGIDGDTIALSIDGGAAIADGITKTETADGYSCSYTPGSALSEGSHSVTFDVSDNDGNAAAQTGVSFVVDTVPPALNVTAPTEGFITNEPTVTVSGTTNDETSSPVTVTVNGSAVAVGTDGAFSTTVTVSEGTNTITVVATDSAGKTTAVTRTVTLDTHAPTITSISVSPNPVDAGQTYVITVVVAD